MACIVSHRAGAPRISIKGAVADDVVTNSGVAMSAKFSMQQENKYLKIRMIVHILLSKRKYSTEGFFPFPFTSGYASIRKRSSKLHSRARLAGCLSSESFWLIQYFPFVYNLLQCFTLEKSNSTQNGLEWKQRTMILIWLTNLCKTFYFFNHLNYSRVE